MVRSGLAFWQWFNAATDCSHQSRLAMGRAARDKQEHVQARTNSSVAPECRIPTGYVFNTSTNCRRLAAGCTKAIARRSGFGPRLAPTTDAALSQNMQ